MNNILHTMIEKYNVKNENDEINAIKEVIQEMVICALSRSDFFEKAAFYGGTALRIFHGLNRFSEDLDFALLEPDKQFDLKKYFSYIEQEAKSYGLNLSISEKTKTKDSNIATAFIKGNTKEHILIFFPNNNFEKTDHILKDIKLKFEIDINPPSGANYETKYKLLPSAHSVKLYDEPSLFAGKIHAILCRNWSNRVKGRDLYDYIFYLSKNTKVNVELIKNKLIASNFISENDKFDIFKLREMLNNKFKTINYEEAKKDVISFINDINSLNIWNDDFFIEITKNLTFE